MVKNIQQAITANALVAEWRHRTENRMGVHLDKDTTSIPR